MLIPADLTPALRLPTVDHGPFDLDRPAGINGTLLMFYRGRHCPKCIDQMNEAAPLLDTFDKLGVDVVAISADSEERATQTVAMTGLNRLKTAHSLNLAAARYDWGLWISAGREGTEEPRLFSEPGLFLVLPGRKLYAAWVQTTPFARPRLADVMTMVRFQQDHGLPPRGAYTGALPA